MNRLWIFIPIFLINLSPSLLLADNQTSTVSPIFPESEVPYSIRIIQENFQLPIGLQSGAFGIYKDFWIFIAGRSSGRHGFDPNPDNQNFPVDKQNTSIYVVNFKTGQSFSRALSDHSGLTQAQIDTLSVTSPQFYQEGTTLYMTGGYGVDSSTNTLSTKPMLTAFNLPGVISWVLGNDSLHYHIRQLSHPVFRVTGGRMYKIGSITQLSLGQNMIGNYTPGSNGLYTQQIRRFRIKHDPNLSVEILPATPPNPNLRRRDLNVVPVLLPNQNHLIYGLVAFAGVFTLTGGAWTVPVVIRETGDATMANPEASNTFKQGMNQYICASTTLYSRKRESVYTLLFGGLSYEFYENGTFVQDPFLPFINQVTSIKMDKAGHFKQYLMNNEFPVIMSSSQPGNRLRFGTSAYFIPANILHYPNDVISLDTLRTPTVIGHIVGGIMAPAPHPGDHSEASPYIFRVVLYPKT